MSSSSPTWISYRMQQMQLTAGRALMIGRRKFAKHKKGGNKKKVLLLCMQEKKSGSSKNSTYAFLSPWREDIHPRIYNLRLDLIGQLTALHGVGLTTYVHTTSGWFYLQVRSAGRPLFEKLVSANSKIFRSHNAVDGTTYSLSLIHI